MIPTGQSVCSSDSETLRGSVLHPSNHVLAIPGEGSARGDPTGSPGDVRKFLQNPGLCGQGRPSPAGVSTCAPGGPCAPRRRGGPPRSLTVPGGARTRPARPRRPRPGARYPSATCRPVLRPPRLYSCVGVPTCDPSATSRGRRHKCGSLRPTYTTSAGVLPPWESGVPSWSLTVLWGTGTGPSPVGPSKRVVLEEGRTSPSSLRRRCHLHWNLEDTQYLTFCLVWSLEPLSPGGDSVGCSDIDSPLGPWSPTRH